jgi:hypothetical protein
MERLAKRQKLIQKKFESLKDRIPIMKSKFPIEDLKLYFKLKNQIPIPNSQSKKMPCPNPFETKKSNLQSKN